MSTITPTKQQIHKLFACRSFTNSSDLPLHSDDRTFPDYITEFFNLNIPKDREVNLEIEVGYWPSNCSWLDLRLSLFNSYVFPISRINILKSLLEDCKIVTQSPAQANNLLPIFPYQDPGYDRQYFVNIKQTILILEDILNEKLFQEPDWTFVFRSFNKD